MCLIGLDPLAASDLGMIAKCLLDSGGARLRVGQGTQTNLRTEESQACCQQDERAYSRGTHDVTDNWSQSRKVGD